MARGHLVYVMGASGAGKTRVIDEARRRIDGTLPVLFAHRYVTRALAQSGGNSVALTPGEFALRREHPPFPFAWETYGLRYGIGIEIDAWRDAGLAVVIDGSRAHFAALTKSGTDILPVLVTAPYAVRRERLIARGRDDAEAIAARLDRAARFQPIHPDLAVLDNSGPIERAGAAFTALLAEKARTP